MVLRMVHCRMAGRFSDPDEMTAEQIFGRTAVNPSLKAPRGEASDAGSAKLSASSRAVQDSKAAPPEADAKEDVLGASRPGSSGGRSRTAGSRPGSAASTRSGWRRRRRSTQNTIGTTYTARTGATAVSTVSSRASQALQSTRARRALAARNVAEDCYSGKLKKKYARGDTYIRKSALRSVTMRGSRLRVDDDKLALKKKLGQRAGEGMDSNNVILQMLGGADSDEEHHTEALKVLAALCMLRGRQRWAYRRFVRSLARNWSRGTWGLRFGRTASKRCCRLPWPL